VVLAEVVGVDVVNRRLLVQDGYVQYDYLVLAAGATHSYFGHDDWATIARGLKSIEDATVMRKRILLAFESAEYEGSDEARRAALTFGTVTDGALALALGVDPADAGVMGRPPRPRGEGVITLRMWLGIVSSAPTWRRARCWCSMRRCPAV
jgi:hypothetical protein